MKTVVIIDNNEEIVNQVKKALQVIKGIEIIGTASNGEDGLLLVRRTIPDIVITDIKMPEIQGTELMEIVVRYEENYVPHFIVITTQDANTIVELRDLPVRRIFYKPFLIKDIVDEVIRIQEDEKVNIIIADDDIEFCKEFKANLSKYEDINILGIANTDEDEIYLIEKLKPDVVITDILRNGELSGEKIIEQYLKDNKSQKFLVISYSHFAVSPLTHKNVVCSMHKYEIEKELDGLVFKLKDAKKKIVRKKVDIISEKNKSNKDKDYNILFSKIISLVKRKMK